MIEKPKTDRLRASASEEFVWDTSEHTAVHKYILQPITELLSQHNVREILDLGCGNGSFYRTNSSEKLQCSRYRPQSLRHIYRAK